MADLSTNLLFELRRHLMIHSIICVASKLKIIDMGNLNSRSLKWILNPLVVGKPVTEVFLPLSLDPLLDSLLTKNGVEVRRVWGHASKVVIVTTEATLVRVRIVSYCQVLGLLTKTLESSQTTIR